MQRSHQEKKKALRKVKSSPTSDNIQQYKIIWGQTRKTTKSTRRQSWQIKKSLEYD